MIMMVSSVSLGGMNSGCQPRRHSSPIVGFWVQRRGTPALSDATQTLQPMHSRMSSCRPSSILRGRKGSAIEGRAAPMKSSVPLVIMVAMVSGEVKRPTPTTGLPVTFLTNRTYSCWYPSWLKRAVWPSRSNGERLTSHRSGSSASISTTSSASSREPGPPSPTKVPTPIRMATAQVSPTASLVSSTSSRRRRARFSRLPPYSSVRWL